MLSQNSCNCTEEYICRVNFADNTHRCECQKGSSSGACANATRVKSCDSSPCKNNATCINKEDNSGYNCTCSAGFTGSDCETQVKPCDTIPCKNNATCTNKDDNSSYNCTCSTGFTGSDCETQVKPCDSSPCKNNATCINDKDNSGYNCTCSAGFTGSDCETQVKPCDSSPCKNNATCTNKEDNSGYNCTCSAGFTGNDCITQDIDECAKGLHGCHANATCDNIAGSYTCKCSHGFTGDGFNCTDIDECARGLHSCHTNATCDNIAGSYTCKCSPGFTGDGFNCTDIDECGGGSHGCHRNALCINTPGSFICRCKNGYLENGSNCIAASSCSAIKSASPKSSSGTYTIDPDGPGGQPAFKVYCNMTANGGVGVTVISHDSESRTYVQNGLSPPGSYSRHVSYYNATWDQLKNLTDVSTHCEQYIQWDCYETMFIAHGYAWWVSRNNAKMTYWGGATPGSNKCACGMTSSCASPSNGCNCDSNDMTWRSDGGLLTDKTALPVREMRFGDFDSSYEEGYHTLGKLKCYGISQA
ncbi:fibropellin-1 isoform X2 [Nematostella vectensis]|uniref:fibropellin-1 isoform X2 n=1 Tax=Nematostella vectensis TaxID=45351 RepID=UPI002076DBFE|nr:fibropellin-1 isoform X2 [Nematostella vectensis]